MVVRLVLRADIRSYLTLSSCNQRKSVIHIHINCAVKHFYLLLVDVHAGMYIIECSNEGIMVSVECSFCHLCVICPIISCRLFPSQIFVCLFYCLSGNLRLLNWTAKPDAQINSMESVMEKVESSKDSIF